MKKGRPVGKRTKAKGKSLGEAIRLLQFGDMAERPECEALARLHDVLTADPKDKYQSFSAEFIQKTKNHAIELLFKAIQSNDADLFFKLAHNLQQRKQRPVDDPQALLVLVAANFIKEGCGRRPTAHNVSAELSYWGQDEIDPRQISRILAELGFKPKSRHKQDNKSS